MLIERPTFILSPLTRGAVFRGKRFDDENKPLVYLTFDDGPDPEITPWVLDRLAERNMKATFFLVGDNAARNRKIVETIIQHGHRVGNHTMHHIQGLRCSTADYLNDIHTASEVIDSKLFRPPHGWLTPKQRKLLQREGWKIIMFDLVTRDYSSKLSAEDVTTNVRRFVRPGSIIVFHDSKKAWPRLKNALPEALDWLSENGFRVAGPDTLIP